MEKKGALEFEIIVVVILIVVGLGILIYFMSSLGWSGLVNTQTCHTSVVLRASMPDTANIDSYVPLKCHTNKICFTSGLIAGSCKEYENTKGITTVKVNSLEDIEREISKDMLSCWTMMGEGKISIFSQWLAEDYSVGQVYPSCVVCSRFAFDREKLAKKGIDLNNLDVQRYMLTHKPAGKDVSYYELLSGSSAIDVDALKNLPVLTITSEKKDGKEIVTYKEEDKLTPETTVSTPTLKNNGEISVMFMQISAPTHSGVFKNTMKALGISVAGSFAIAPMKTVSSLRVLANPYVAGIAIIFGLGLPQANVFANQNVATGYCGDVEYGGDAREGCSVVRTVDYDEKSLKQYCTVIESIG